MEESLERIYTIPLRKVKWGSRNGQADRAVRAIRAYLTKHMKAEEVWIDAAVNRHVWRRGKFRIPSSVRVRARLFDDGVCEVSLPEEETKAGESIREQLSEARERKLEEAHKGELEELERAEAEGAATPTGVTRPTRPEGEADEEEEPEAEEEEPEEQTPEPKPAAAKNEPKASAKPAEGTSKAKAEDAEKATPKEKDAQKPKSAKKETEGGSKD